MERREMEVKHPSAPALRARDRRTPYPGILNMASNIPITLWIVVAIAICLRLYGIDFGLPLHLHPDEWSQVELARRVLEGHLNPGFFRYPSFTIYLLAGVYAIAQWFFGLLSISPTQETYYIVARVMSSVFGAFTVIPVFYIAVRLGNLRTAFTAAVLVAIAPELVRQSHYATVDVASTFWCMVSLALALAVRWGDVKSYLPASIAAGLALSTKYSAVYILPVLLGLIAYGTWQKRAHERAPSHSRRRALAVMLVSVVGLAGFVLLPQEWIIATLRHWTTDGIVEPEYLTLLHRVVMTGIILCALSGILSLASLFNDRAARIIETITDRQVLLYSMSIALVFAITSPFVTLDPAHSVRDIAYEYRHVLIGPAAQFKLGDPILDSLKATQQQDGQLFYWEWWIGQNGWVMLAGVLLGMVYLGKKDLVLLLVLAVPIILLSVSLTIAGNKAVRYALLIVPLADILAASALSLIVIRKRVWRMALLVLPTAALVVVPAWATLASLHVEFYLPDTRTQAFLLAQEQHSSGEH